MYIKFPLIFYFIISLKSHYVYYFKVYDEIKLFCQVEALEVQLLSNTPTFYSKQNLLYNLNFDYILTTF